MPRLLYSELFGRELLLEKTLGADMEGSPMHQKLLAAYDKLFAVAVQAIGVQIAMDDFGTGYSSLSYLAKLPINSLKINRSFISEMTDGPEQLAIVSTVISLGRALNLKVVAEGVETEEQKKLLAQLKCDEIQGYLLSPPLSFEKIETLMKQRKQQIYD